MTEDEYVSSLSHSRRFEFSNGVVTAKRGPFTTQKKQWIVADELTEAFRDYRRRVGGITGQTPTTNFSDGPDRLYRMPDIAYWAAGRRVGEGISEPPTVAIEIVSPDQSVSDLRRKCVFYRERRVDVCWLIEPEARWVEVWDASRDGLRLPAGTVLAAPALPGFELEIDALWRAIDSAPD